MEKVRISYNHYGFMLDQLLSAIKLKKDVFSFIHGIPRGGLPIAVHLSHYLYVDMLPEAELNSLYDLYESTNVDSDSRETILIVDDICDTGETLHELVHKFKSTGLNNQVDVKTAVLFHKPHAKFIPDYYVQETTDWIVFPWEMMEEKPNREMYEHLGD